MQPLAEYRQYSVWPPIVSDYVTGTVLVQGRICGCGAAEDKLPLAATRCRSKAIGWRLTALTRERDTRGVLDLLGKAYDFATDDAGVVNTATWYGDIALLRHALDSGGSVCKEGMNGYRRITTIFYLNASSDHLVGRHYWLVFLQESQRSKAVCKVALSFTPLCSKSISRMRALAGLRSSAITAPASKVVLPPPMKP